MRTLRATPHPTTGGTPGALHQGANVHSNGNAEEKDNRKKDKDRGGYGKPQEFQAGDKELRGLKTTKGQMTNDSQHNNGVSHNTQI